MEMRGLVERLATVPEVRLRIILLAHAVWHDGELDEKALDKMQADFNLAVAELEEYTRGTAVTVAHLRDLL